MNDIGVLGSHPRHQSPLTRHRIERSVEKGTTSRQGLIAQGYGEAFNYLLGERTLPSSDEATRAAATHLLLVDQPVASINGNVAVLCPGEVVDPAAAVDADIEMNLFSRTDERIRAIAAHLRDHSVGGAKRLTSDGRVPGIDHECAKVDVDGIGNADVVAVLLEDGDWTEAFGAVDKVEIVVDLDPVSRSVQITAVFIVDSIMRAVPNIAAYAHDLRGSGTTCEELETIIADFGVDAALSAAERMIRAGDE